MTTRMRLAIVAVLGAFGGACDNGGTLPPPPTVVTFEFRNDGSEAVFVKQNCLLTYTITSLADPVRQIARQGACSCDCAVATCPVCGPCFEGPVEVASGAAVMEGWTAVNVTYEPRTQGAACERKHTLPPGPYRIDVPVFPTPLDADENTNGRIATQTFTLPATDDHVTVSLGVSP